MHFIFTENENHVLLFTAQQQPVTLLRIIQQNRSFDQRPLHDTALALEPVVILHLVALEEQDLRPQDQRQPPYRNMFLEVIVQPQTQEGAIYQGIIVHEEEALPLGDLGL